MGRKEQERKMEAGSFRNKEKGLKSLSNYLQRQEVWEEEKKI